MRLVILLLWGALCALQAVILDEAQLLNQEVKDKLTTMSAELEAKTGIKAHLITHPNTNNLPVGSIPANYLQMHDLEGEYAVLVLVPPKAGEKTGKVDLFLSNPELCDKEEILSPLPNTGSILPILTANKAEDVYNAALLNGFADVCERIAAGKNAVLTTAIGNQNRSTINFVRYFIYGFLVLAILIFAYKSMRAKIKK